MRYASVARAQRPWVLAEEKCLLELQQIHDTDYTAIAIDLEKHGWYRTPSVLRKKLRRLGIAVEQRKVGIIDDMQKLAICKPWR